MLEKYVYFLRPLFFIMPYVYAFGTNSNYWLVGETAAIFWLLTGLVLLGPVVSKHGGWYVVMPLVFATQAIVATLLHTAMTQPYRQPQPLWLNNAIVEFGRSNSRLKVSTPWQQYIDEIKSRSGSAGYVAGIPVIDLTGESPGALYALGAESLGQPWMIGGYPGSLAQAVAAFKKVPCEKIKSAWILIEPEGKRKIPLDLLEILGMKFPHDYQLAAEWDAAPIKNKPRQPHKQLFYAPKDNQNIYASCLAARGITSP